MATSVIFEEQVEIPGGIRTLADFRDWARSDEFPEQGRMDDTHEKVYQMLNQVGISYESADLAEEGLADAEAP